MEMCSIWDVFLCLARGVGGELSKQLCSQPDTKQTPIWVSATCLNGRGNWGMGRGWGVGEHNEYAKTSMFIVFGRGILLDTKQLVTIKIK